MFRKASPSVWLNLRLRAPGLAGPFLQEFNAAYRHLDEFDSWKPKVILVVGGDAKRKAIFGEVPNSPNNDGTRTLSTYHDTLLIDCEVHQSTNPPRVLGGPVPGHYSIHCLEGRNSGVTPFIVTVRLYSKILSLFSAIVLIFASNFNYI